MSDKEERIPVQFGPWLVSQISSGKYPGLEWIDGDRKTMFKIPWTKVNYPMWEEHHKIFEAWAIHRGKGVSDSGRLEQSFSQVKSNFRTILRKCVEIEEVEDAHQLGLQMGNYKVYRLLSREESLEKKKLQLKTRKAYKWLKEMKTKQTGGFENEVIDNEGEQFLEFFRTRRKKSSKIKAFIKETDPTPANSRNASTQTCLSDTTDMTFLLEPGAFEEAVVSDATSITIGDGACAALHHSVSTQIECQDMEVESAQSNSPEMAIPNSNKLSGFEMLLEAAQMTEGRSANKSPIKSNPCHFAPPSVVDVMVEMKVPPEELFTYEMHVRYETREVMEKTLLSDMSYGYRIHNDNPTSSLKKSLYLSRGMDELAEDFDRTPIALPDAKIPPGNSLYTVLKNMNGGVVVKSDQQHTLVAKRLCLSRVYAFTSFGDVHDDVEPMLLPRHRDVVLFSYQKFISEWHQFLLDGSPKPNVEINLVFGKKARHRHSRVFVAITLIPKAAQTMLERLSHDIDDTTVDNILNLFNPM